MRLSEDAVRTIRQLVLEAAGADAKVRLFGSRVDDSARGGDVDLMVEVAEAVPRPAELAALLSARISRGLGGRRVDVLIAAPNLMSLPVHRQARENGIIL